MPEKSPIGFSDSDARNQSERPMDRKTRRSEFGQKNSILSDSGLSPQCSVGRRTWKSTRLRPLASLMAAKDRKIWTQKERGESNFTRNNGNYVKCSWYDVSHHNLTWAKMKVQTFGILRSMLKFAMSVL